MKLLKHKYQRADAIKLIFLAKTIALLNSPLNILLVKTNDDLVVDYPNCNITLVHVFRIQIIW